MTSLVHPIIPPPLPKIGADANAEVPSGEIIVSVQNLCRTFSNVEAVRDISFNIHRGQVVGFIGANGAGKTTTMRIISTLEQPTSGKVSVCGYDVVHSPAEVRRLIGMMPDHYGAYQHMTIYEYLDFYGRAYGFPHAERRARVEEVMDFADLTPIADRLVNKLSKGMAQRVCFGRTLLHDPEFLLLDEPAAGLDPKARIEFKNLVRLLSARGKTIFISSHILTELDEMCDTLLFIDAGRLVHHGSSQTLKTDQRAGVVVNVQVEGAVQALLEWATLNPGWSVIEELKHGARLRCETTAATQLASGLRKMTHDGLAVVDFHREERRLEDAFVDILKGNHP
jgi:ABC-2 type transport system ATP-binding protein